MKSADVTSSGPAHLMPGVCLLLVFVLGLGPDLASGQVSSALVFDFDCRRNQVSCGDSSTCDMTSGECDCSTAATTDIGESRNYRCEDSRESGTCAPPCLNGGVCVNGACSCGNSHYGATCEMPRVQVACQSTSMFLNVNPDTDTFAGAIYVSGKQDVSECNLKAGTGDPGLGDHIANKDQLAGYWLELTNENAACGTVTAQEKTEDGVTFLAYTRTYLVQYNTNFLSTLDQVITVDCKVTGEVSSSVQTVDETATNYTPVDADDSIEVVTFTLVKQDGTDITTNVELGLQMELRFSMSRANGFDDFQLGRCVATNAIDQVTDADNYKEVLFITDGCPSSEAYALFWGKVEKTVPAALTSDPVTVVARTKAFLFLGTSNQLMFRCDITFCTADNTAPCQQKPCPGIDPPADSAPADTSAPGGETPDDTSDPGGETPDDTPATGGETPDDTPATGGETPAEAPAERKRRSTSTEEKVSQVLTVQEPGTSVQAAPESSDSSPTECMQQPEVVASVAILSITVLLLLCACVILLIRVMRQRRKVDALFKNRITPVETMSIPRLRMNIS